jgi:pyrroloquinoline quinone biosynthesis protein B
MRVRVLGSAAGGGFPQWNCGCFNCRGVRAGLIAAVPRTQESVAVSADGDSWFLLNASPEVRAQLESFPPLHPRADRQSPIAGILLTNGDLDHCLGLLCLRESQPLRVYATERVRSGFTENNSMYATLQRFPGHTTWPGLPLGEARQLDGVGGGPSGLSVQAVALPGQRPLHLKSVPLKSGASGSRQDDVHPQDNVGLIIREASSGATLAYFPGCARITESVLAAVADAQCLFFDGTFWSNDELIELGLGDRRAEDMAHVPIASPAGSLVSFAPCKVARRIFIHINNTNPILREDSEERRVVREAGWQVAHDGLELELDGRERAFDGRVAG